MPTLICAARGGTPPPYLRRWPFASIFDENQTFVVAVSQKRALL